MLATITNINKMMMMVMYSLILKNIPEMRTFPEMRASPTKCKTFSAGFISFMIYTVTQIKVF